MGEKIELFDGPVVVRAGALRYPDDDFQIGESVEDLDPDELVLIKPVGDNYEQHLWIETYDPEEDGAFVDERRVIDDE